VRIKATLAALMAAMVLSVSLSSAACDLSCAFNQLHSNCDSPPSTTTQRTRLGEPLQMPMQMEGTDHAHHAHESKLDRIELATIHASSMGLCHQPCAKPATLSLHKIRPTAPQFAVAVLTVVAHLQPDDTFSRRRHFDSGSFPRNLSALDPLSTSLRI